MLTNRVPSREISLEIVPSLNNTYGSFLICAILAAILYGILILQVFLYFMNQWNDALHRRVSVIWLCVCNTFHMIMISHVVYYYLVSNYANPPALELLVWSFKAQNTAEILIITSVQTLYVIRLVRLNSLAGKRKLLSYVALGIVPISWGVGGVAIWVFFKLRQYLEPNTTWVPYLSLGFCALYDALIAISMFYILRESRPKFSGPMKSIVDLFIAYTINTGALTSLCSLTALICFATMPHNLIFLALNFPLTNLYPNCYLALLNARPYLSNRLGRVHIIGDLEFPLAHSSVSPNPNSSVTRTSSSRPQTASGTDELSLTTFSRSYDRGRTGDDAKAFVTKLPELIEVTIERDVYREDE